MTPINAIGAPLNSLAESSSGVRPVCAPLRLPCHIAPDVPIRQSLKTKHMSELREGFAG
jgi:hypothetical protein